MKTPWADLFMGVTAQGTQKGLLCMFIVECGTCTRARTRRQATRVAVTLTCSHLTVNEEKSACSPAKSQNLSTAIFALAVNL